MAVIHIGNNKHKILCECDNCHDTYICKTPSCIHFEKTFCPKCLKNYDKEENELVRLFYPLSNRRVVQGYNDLYTKYPEVTEYIVNKDIAKTYSYGTSHKFETKCPVCGRVKIQSVRGIIAYRKYNCDYCDVDYVSYPNKVLRAFMKQLRTDVLEFEYSPEWLKPYSFDCYFEINGSKYVIEMDGGLGHGNNTFGNKGKDVEGLKRDIYKENKARKNGIEVIRIDCKKSDIEYIRHNLINSKLSDIFDLLNIDWQSCDDFALKNLVYEVCNFYKNATIDNKRTAVIANEFGLDITTVEKYLRLGTKAGFCFYDKALANKLRIESTTKTHRDKAFKIKILTKDNKCIGIYKMEEAISYLRKNTSTTSADFYIAGAIRRVCRKEKHRNYYFGYRFEYAIS